MCSKMQTDTCFPPSPDSIGGFEHAFLKSITKFTLAMSAAHGHWIINMH